MKFPQVVERPLKQQSIHAHVAPLHWRGGEQALVVQHSDVEADRKHQLLVLPVTQLHTKRGACAEKTHRREVTMRRV